MINFKESAMGDPLAAQFQTFCNFGAGGGSKNTLTDKNMTKLFKDCKLYGKNLTSTDTDIAFSKVKEKAKKELTLDQFKALLRDVAPKYQKDNKLASANEAFDAMCQAIINNGPSTAGTTGMSKTGAVDRMTDHTQYTGSHKERFDQSGRGKGLEGRADIKDNSGYVGNYKGAGTYDEKKN